jgi:hypothetical protein
MNSPPVTISPRLQSARASLKVPTGIPGDSYLTIVSAVHRGSLTRLSPITSINILEKNMIHG